MENSRRSTKPSFTPEKARHQKTLDNYLLEGLKMIKMEIKNKDPDKTFTAYFETKKDLQNFKDFIETLIENVKKESLKQ